MSQEGLQIFGMAIGTAFCVLSAQSRLRAYSNLILEGGYAEFVLVRCMHPPEFADAADKLFSKKEV